MKSVRQMRWLLWGLGLWIGFSCDNTLDVLAPKQERPIIYAVWSVHDSLPAVRVQRTFLNPGQDVREVAQNPDSIYYTEPIQVFAEEWKNGVLQRTIRFRQYADSSKDSGTFYYPHQPLYRPEAPIQLDAEAEYVLKVKVGEQLPTAEARTRLVGPVGFLNPRPMDPPIEFRFSTRQTYVVSWFSADNAHYYDLWMTFSIREIRGGDTQWIRFRVPLLRMTTAQPGQRLSYVLTLEDFYYHLTQNLTIDSTVRRYFGALTFGFRGVEKQHYYYERLNGTSQSINQTDTFYTNIKNGLGLFSSATIDSAVVKPSLAVRDSLRLNPLLQPYNFQ